MTARFRGWSAFIGLQIEYSLLERTVEQELTPMALELGLGVTPWSPLKSGVLERQVHARERAAGQGRPRRLHERAALNEKTFTLLDELAKIAKAHDSTVARVAIAWVQAQPAVTSTIIGARRMAQLEDNVRALEVTLTAEELARLDALTKPTLGFPANMQPMFPSIHHAGATVNGVPSQPSPFVLQKGERPY